MKLIIGLVSGILIGVILVYIICCPKPSTGTILHASQRVPDLDPSRIIWKPESSTDWSPNGRKEVLGIIADMEEKLKMASVKGTLQKGGNIAIEIAFSRNGSFIGYDGITRHGGKKIKKYFDQIVSDPDRKITDIQFQLEVVYAEEFTWNTNGGLDEDPLHPIYFIISCSYNLDGKRYDPPGSTHCVHIRACDCEL